MKERFEESKSLTTISSPPLEVIEWLEGRMLHEKDVCEMKERLLRLEKFADCARERLHEHQTVIQSHVMAMEHLLEIAKDMKDSLHIMSQCMEERG